MLKITYAHGESQPLHSGNAKAAPQPGTAATPTGNAAVPLSDFFMLAMEENKVYYASKQASHQFASPLFKLVQRLKSHPDFKDYAAEDAFKLLNKKLKPDWGTLFPNVPIPPLEFITAWEQINLPAGSSFWEAIQERVINQPLTLLVTPGCEGFEHYLLHSLPSPTIHAKEGYPTPCKDTEWSFDEADG